MVGEGRGVRTLGVGDVVAGEGRDGEWWLGCGAEVDGVLGLICSCEGVLFLSMLGERKGRCRRMSFFIVEQGRGYGIILTSCFFWIEMLSKWNMLDLGCL